ncbi:MAG: hypothetical protein ACTHZD_12740 [Micrococcaceae bacterium]
MRALDEDQLLGIIGELPPSGPMWLFRVRCSISVPESSRPRPHDPAAFAARMIGDWEVNRVEPVPFLAVSETDAEDVHD